MPGGSGGLTVASWPLVLCGTNHRRATLPELEPLCIAAEKLVPANAALVRQHEVPEALVLSTCNRVEFYFVVQPRHDPLAVVSRFYEEHTGLDLGARRGLFDVRLGTDVAPHLFRVAAGLDSAVLGENQILGQVKSAYSAACAAHSAGKMIHRLFHQAFRAGKQVRSETDMSRGACSVSTAAVEMLRQRRVFRDDARVLLIGANRMIELAAERLSQVPGLQLCFANRTKTKAQVLARPYAAEAFDLTALTDHLVAADVVITCTAATEPIITSRMLTDVVSGKTGRVCTLVDLAVPRDVEPPQEKLPGLEILDLDSVNRFVTGQQQKRLGAVPEAEDVIAHRAAEFNYWYLQVLREPRYNGDAPTLESIRTEELAPLLAALPADLQSELNRVTRRLVQRVAAVTRRPKTHSTES
jgi:glutamyl-tRNA reductase